MSRKAPPSEPEEPTSRGVGSGRRRYQTGKHLEAFLLLLVAMEPDHGGSLIARLRAVVPDAFTIDSGRTYRLLRDLEGEGVLTSEWRLPAPAEGGPPLRVYALTEKGYARLDAWREEIGVRQAALTRFLRLYAEYARTAARTDGAAER